MRRAIAIASGLALCGGCGGESPPDGTSAFISCLQHRGGALVTAASQLASYPSQDLQQGASASLESVDYFSIDVAAGTAGQRQALVFVRAPHDPVAGPMPAPTEWLTRARHGDAGVRALILMPLAEDPERPIGSCEQIAAPGQSVP